MHQRALEIYEKVLGPEHLFTITSVGNLGSVLHSQGKYEEAEPLLKRSLAIREKGLGPEAPELAPKLESYASVLRKMNRNIEATQLEARAQSIRADHPGAKFRKIDN